MHLHRFFCGLSMALSLAIAFPSQAHSAASGCNDSADNPATCQYLVTSGDIAPSPSTSTYIHQPSTTSLVLYDRENDSSLYGYCRYVTNNAGNDYFVPQGSKNDFVNFLKNPPANVTLVNCVMPITYAPIPAFPFSSFSLFSSGASPANGSGPAPASSLGASFTVPMPSAVQPAGTVLIFTPSFTYSRSDCRMIHNVPVCNPPVTIVETQTIQFTAAAPASVWTDGVWVMAVLSDQCTVNGVATGAAPAGCLADWGPPPDCHSYVASWSDSSTNTSCNGSFRGTTLDANYLVMETDPTSRGVPVNQGAATFLCEKGVYVPQPGSTCVTPIYGNCGAATSASTYDAPAANLCASGTATVPTENATTGFWEWICRGNSIQANSPTCQSGITLDGRCGRANDLSSKTPPDKNLCNSGVSAAVTNNGAGSWTWACLGVNGGKDTACAAPAAQ